MKKKPARHGARLWLAVRHTVGGHIERRRPNTSPEAPRETVARLAAACGLRIDEKGRVG